MLSHVILFLQNNGQCQHNPLLQSAVVQNNTHSMAMFDIKPEVIISLHYTRFNAEAFMKVPASNLSLLFSSSSLSLLTSSTTFSIVLCHMWQWKPQPKILNCQLLYFFLHCHNICEIFNHSENAECGNQWNWLVFLTAFHYSIQLHLIQSSVPWFLTQSR